MTFQFSGMKVELLKQAVIHTDETPVQILNEQSWKNTTKPFLWVYTNEEYEQLTIFLCFVMSTIPNV